MASSKSASKFEIARWMREHLDDHRDRTTGEVNCTSLVEEWDVACADGGATLDSNHVAWDVAVEVAARADAGLP